MSSQMLSPIVFSGAYSQDSAHRTNRQAIVAYLEHVQIALQSRNSVWVHLIASSYMIQVRPGQTAMQHVQLASQGQHTVGEGM